MGLLRLAFTLIFSARWAHLSAWVLLAALMPQFISKFGGGWRSAGGVIGPVRRAQKPGCLPKIPQYSVFA